MYSVIVFGVTLAPVMVVMPRSLRNSQKATKDVSAVPRLLLE
jgi:hypothetical protein